METKTAKNMAIGALLSALLAFLTGFSFVSGMHFERNTVARVAQELQPAVEKSADPKAPQPRKR